MLNNYEDKLLERVNYKKIQNDSKETQNDIKEMQIMYSVLLPRDYSYS